MTGSKGYLRNIILILITKEFAFLASKSKILSKSHWLLQANKDLSWRRTISPDRSGSSSCWPTRDEEAGAPVFSREQEGPCLFS